MNVIILAAGQGIRIRDTIDIPKCLIEVNGISLLHRSLYKITSTIGRYIDNIFIVTGYKTEMIESALCSPYYKVVWNEYFDQLNTAMSLYRGLLYCKTNDVMIIESDLLYTNDHLEQSFLNCDSILVANPMNDLDDKVYVSVTNGCVSGLSKIEPEKHIGEFIGISRTDVESLRYLCGKYPYLCYEDILVKMDLRPIICSEPWQEIDTEEHYKKALEKRWNVDI